MKEGESQEIENTKEEEKNPENEEERNPTNESAKTEKGNRKGEDPKGKEQDQGGVINSGSAKNTERNQ